MNTISFLISYVTEFYHRCRKLIPTQKIHRMPDFLQVCSQGDLNSVKKITGGTLVPLETLNIGLLNSIESGSEPLVSFLLELKQPPINLNQALELSVKKGYSSISETLLKKGALPLAGLRVCKDRNIFSMLYRYENKVENIK